MYQAVAVIRKYMIYGGRRFRKEIGMTKNTSSDLRKVIDNLLDSMALQSSNNITSIPTYDLLHQVNILKDVLYQYSCDGTHCVTIEEVDSDKFEDCVSAYLSNGYKISASSCNSKTWKAILVKEDKEQESE